MKRTFAVMALLTLFLSACASSRGVRVGTDSTTTYRVEVHNSHSSALTVAYTDSRGSHDLGTVAGGRSGQFVIASPSATTVKIVGMTAGGGHYETTVSLAAGTTVRANL